MQDKYTKEELIQKLGLSGMDASKQDALVQAVYATLNMRMAMLIEGKLSDEQLQEFSNLNNQKSDEAVNWLLKTFPDYQQQVDTELEAIIEEVKTKTDQITGAN